MDNISASLINTDIIKAQNISNKSFKKKRIALTQSPSQESHYPYQRL